MRMRVKGSARKAEIGRMLLIETLHPFALAAHNTDRQPTSQRLAVGNEIRLHAEVLLRTTRCQPESQKNLIKNQRDSACGADSAQFTQPGRIGGPIKSGPTRTVDQRRIARRVGVGVQCLQRIDQHTRNIATRLKHTQRPLREVLERVGLAGRQGVSGSWLHILPPAVIRTAKSNQMRPSGPVTGNANGLHHRLGSRHVEAHFVQSGDTPQALDDIENDRVIGAQHWPQISHAGNACGNGFFIEIIAKYVNAVRTREIHESLAVQIFDGHPSGRLHKTAQLQMTAQVRAELKRYPVTPSELHIGKVVARLIAQGNGLGMARSERLAEIEKTSASPCHDLGGRIIGSKKTGFVVAVSRDQRCHALGHSRVTRQRAVFGARQRDSLRGGWPTNGQRTESQRRHG